MANRVAYEPMTLGNMRARHDAPTRLVPRAELLAAAAGALPPAQLSQIRRYWGRHRGRAAPFNDRSTPDSAISSRIISRILSGYQAPQILAQRTGSALINSSNAFDSALPPPLS